MTDDTKPTPADDDAVDASTELDATPEPAAETATDETPTLAGFDRRTAGFTAIGISALLIAFFGGYAFGDHDGDDERGFRAEPMGMRGSLDGGGHRQQQGGLRGEVRHGRRAGGSIGAVIRVDGDEVTVKPARGDDVVTLDRADVVAVGGWHGRDDAEDTVELEVGDIVVFRAEE